MTVADIEWGPEIKVDGKRPAWLGRDKFKWRREDGEMTSYGDWIADEPFLRWPQIYAISLPANHSHYAQQTPTPDVVGRMEALEAFVKVVTTNYCASVPYELLKRAQALVPEPVDGDVIEARKIAAAHCDDPLDGIRFINGERDEGVALPPILAAIRRGRALERGEAA